MVIKMRKKIIFIILICGIAIFGLVTYKDNEVKPVSNDGVSNGGDSLENKFKDKKYYIDKNLARYLKYYENHSDLSFDKIISDVNSNLDKTKYEDVTETDLGKDTLMLVNKYYYLKDNYTPNDLVTLTDEYNIGKNNTMRKVAADAFMEMSDAALLDNISIKNASAYRSYDYQVTLYNNYVAKDGKDAADTYSARPGFSEHQTGLCTDINQINSGFEKTDAFMWLEKNAYKYGFVIRFPRDKEDITGYSYESWHWRYVGKQAAKIIKNENLTLEEYYAYYVEK